MVSRVKRYFLEIKDFSKNNKSEVLTLSTLKKNSVSKIKSKLISYAS